MKKVLASFLFIISLNYAYSQSTGDIQFIAYNSDGNDDFAVVLLTELDGSSSSIDIIFTDNEWDGSAFTVGEDELTWTISSLITAGTVVTFSSVDTGTPSVSVGSLSGSDMNLTNSNEAIFAITGSQASPTAFLAALTNDDFVAAGASLSNTGLTVGTTAIELDAVDADTDIAEYTGSKIGTKSELQTSINTGSNWTTQDATGDQSNDATEPDVPFDATAFSISTDITWDGSEGSGWQTAGNWDTNSVPTSIDNVIIPNATTAPDIDEDITIQDLTIASSGLLVISSNTLQVNGDFTNNQSEGLQIASGGSFILLGSRSGAGTTNAKRTISGSGAYNVIGYPMSSVDLAAQGFDFLYDYNNSTQAFFVPSGSAVAGKGYFASDLGSGVEISATGQIYSANVDIAATQNTDNFNLLANPYTAAIDAASFFTENSAVLSGTAWLWNDGGQNNGGDRRGNYITVNSAGSASGSVAPSNTPGEGSPSKTTGDWNGSFNAFQGFFVEASSAGTVTFTQSMQVTGDNDDGSFFRTGDTMSKLRLTLKTPQVDLADNILIVLDESSTMGPDYSMDGKKLSGNEYISFYSIQDEEQYAISALPIDYEEGMELQLGFDLSEPGQYLIQVDEFDNFRTNADVLLIDTQTGIEYDLSATIQIPFEIQAGVSNNERFKVIFHTKETDSEGEVTAIADNEQIPFYIYGNQSVLYVAFPEAVEERVGIYNTSGQIVFDQFVNFDGGVARIQGLSLLKTQMYVIRIGERALKFVLK